MSVFVRASLSGLPKTMPWQACPGSRARPAYKFAAPPATGPTAPGPAYEFAKSAALDAATLALLDAAASLRR